MDKPKIEKVDTDDLKTPLRKFVVLDIDKEGDGNLEQVIITREKYLKNKNLYENSNSCNPFSFDTREEAENFISDALD